VFSLATGYRLIHSLHVIYVTRYSVVNEPGNWILIITKWSNKRPKTSWDIFSSNLRSKTRQIEFSNVAFCSGSIDLTSCLPVTLLHQIHLLYLICFSTISRPKRTISYVIHYNLNSSIVFGQLTASFGNRLTGFRSALTINNLPVLIDTGNSSN